MPKAVFCLITAATCGYCKQLFGDGRLNNKSPYMQEQIYSSILDDDIFFLSLKFESMDDKSLSNVHKGVMMISHIYKEKDKIKQIIYHKDKQWINVEENGKMKPFMIGGKRIEWEKFASKRYPSSLIVPHFEGVMGFPEFLITTWTDWKEAIEGKKLVALLPTYHPEIREGKMTMIPDSENHREQSTNLNLAVNKINFCKQIERIDVIDKEKEKEEAKRAILNAPPKKKEIYLYDRSFFKHGKYLMF